MLVLIALMYAFRKTGVYVCEENEKAFARDQTGAFAAVEGYRFHPNGGVQSRHDAWRATDSTVGRSHPRREQLPLFQVLTPRALDDVAALRSPADVLQMCEGPLDCRLSSRSAIRRTRLIPDSPQAR